MGKPWLGSQPKETVSVDADCVVEWYVENDHEKYKRLSLVGVPASRVVTYEGTDGGLGRRERVKLVPTHAVVCVVLEVPLADLEKTTNQLRASTKIRPTAPYLAAAAQAAEGLSEIRDRVATLERTNQQLQLEVLDQAHTMDSYDKDIDRAEHNLDESVWSRMGGHTKLCRPPTSRFDRHVKRAKAKLHEISAGVADELKRVKDALDEKRADVAAKLLAGMADGDW